MKNKKESKIMKSVILISLCFVMINSSFALSGLLCSSPAEAATTPTGDAAAATSSGQVLSQPTSPVTTLPIQPTTATVGGIKQGDVWFTNPPGFTKVSEGTQRTVYQDAAGNRILVDTTSGKVLNIVHSTPAPEGTQAATSQAQVPELPSTPSEVNAPIENPVPFLGTVSNVQTSGAAGVQSKPVPLKNGQTLNLLDPLNILKPNSVTGYLNVNDKSGDHILQISGKYYRVNPDGSSWTQVRSTTDLTAISTTTVVQNGYAITQNGKTTFYSPSGSVIGNIPNLDSTLVSQLSVSPDGKSLVTQAGEKVTITNGGKNINIYDENGKLVRTSESINGYRLDCDAEQSNCNMFDKNGNPLTSFPSNFDVTQLIISNGVISFPSGDPSSSHTVTTLDTADGSVTTKAYNGNILSSQNRYNSDGTRDVFHVDSSGDVPSYSRYDQRGFLTSYVVSSSDGSSVTSYAVDDNGKVTATSYTLDKDGNIVQNTMKDVGINNIPDDARNAIAGDLFWTGRARNSNLNVGFIARDIAAGLFSAVNTYNQLGTINSWLGRDKELQKKSEDVDAYFSRHYLGVEPIVGGICSVWTKKTDAPSTIAFGEQGNAAAHIEGERIKSSTNSGNSVSNTFIYRITFAVDPSSTLIHEDDSITFKVYVTGPGGTGPVRITKGADGSDVITLKGNSAPYSILGSDMIVRESSNDYNTVCLDFTGNDISKFQGTFGRFIEQSNGLLCNTLIDNNEEVPSIANSGAPSTVNGL